jgi:hypothetical protein
MRTAARAVLLARGREYRVCRETDGVGSVPIDTRERGEDAVARGAGRKALGGGTAAFILLALIAFPHQSAFVVDHIIAWAATPTRNIITFFQCVFPG